MRKASIALMTLVLSFSILFMGIGYANLSKELIAQGSLHAHIQSGLFISDVVTTGQVNATEQVDQFVQTVFDTTVTLGDTSDSSVSYRVEFFNNDIKDLAYNGTVYDPAAYDNPDITFAVSDILDGAVIPVGGQLSLTVTFSYQDGVVAKNDTLNAIIGFQFGEVIVFEEDPGKFEPGENYNALIAKILTNSNGYGLNDNHKGYVIHNSLMDSKNEGLLYSTDQVQGGNVDKMLGALQSATANIDFVFERISDTEYVTYLFSRNEAIEGNIATVFKQFFHYNGSAWYAGSAMIGHAEMKEIKRPKGSPTSLVPSEWIVGRPPSTEA